MDNLGYLIAYLLFVGMLLVKEEKVRDENEEVNHGQEKAGDWQEKTQDETVSR